MRIRQHGWQPLARGCNEANRPTGAVRTYRKGLRRNARLRPLSLRASMLEGLGARA
jgi:hypothetical protein